MTDTDTRPVRPAMPALIPGRCDASGWRCVRHSPAALNGQPEAPEPQTKEQQQ